MRARDERGGQWHCPERTKKKPTISRHNTENILENRCFYPRQDKDKRAIATKSVSMAFANNHEQNGCYTDDNTRDDVRGERLVENECAYHDSRYWFEGT